MYNSNNNYGYGYYYDTTTPVSGRSCPAASKLYGGNYKINVGEVDYVGKFEGVLETRFGVRLRLSFGDNSMYEQFVDSCKSTNQEISALGPRSGLPQPQRD
ncbi:hypothetical protein K443DRAFT_228503 [Laccaria amethystina LaAM-08-1]|uniref:Uncharacterized protein n=1 Tax=Laccaria amethystina LaAM-08-1 TaxID=1095629 RepID=A0A0C9WM34_9AGAR|nr:hypothetical protein K443DRAFT_228503 [Laccaria amethystina LaAM-08-1]